MSDEHREAIVIPGPREILVQAFGNFRQTQQNAYKIKKDPDTARVIGYFEGKKRLASLAEIYKRFDEFEPRENTHLKPTLKQLMDLHKKQWLAAREVVGALINLHASQNSIHEPQCVYWGAGYDEFALGLGGGYWRYVGGYGEVELSRVPSDWNVASDRAGVWIKGKPSVVNYDVASPDLHPLIPQDSVDVALYKTVGSVFVQQPEILRGFWDKIGRTTKKGGLLITTDRIPREVTEEYEPCEAAIEALGTSRLELNAPMAYSTLLKGYTADRFDFFTHKKR